MYFRPLLAEASSAVESSIASSSASADSSASSMGSMMGSLLKTESLVLTLLFIGILVILALVFLGGLLRGWRYGTYHLAFFTVLFIVAFATLGAQANAIGGITISQFFGDITVNGQVVKGFTIPYNGENVPVEASTIFGTIQEAIAQMMKAANLGSPTEINSYALSLTQSLLKTIMIVVDAVVLSIVGSLLSLLLWHIAFKHIIPKDQRKASYKKGKLISAFEELAVGIVLLSMFIMPFTSIVNAISHNFNDPSEEDDKSLRGVNDDSTYSMIKNAIDTYDNSVFSKVFFTWNINSKGESFDETLIKGLTKGGFSETEVSCVDLIGDATKIGSIAFEAGLFDQKNMNNVGYLAFLASHWAPELLNAMSDSSLITTLLPVGVDFALSMQQIKAFLETDEGVDTSSVNWADSLKNLSGLVVDIQNAGILNIFTPNAESAGNVKLSSDGITALFDEAHRAQFNQVLNDLDSDDFELLNKLVSTAMYIMACKQSKANYELEGGRAANALDITDFLPAIDSTEDANGYPAWDRGTENGTAGDGIPDALPQSFKTLKLGSEVARLYNTIVDLNTNLAKEPTPVTDFIPTLAGKVATNTLTSDTYLADILIDHPKVIEQAIVGPRNSDGSLNKSTEVLDENGKCKTAYCLMDSTFLGYALPRLCSIVANTLTSSQNLGSIDLTATLNGFDGLLDYKEEFNAMFNIANCLIAPTNNDNGIGKAFIKHTDLKPGIYYNKDGENGANGTFNSIDNGLLDDLIAMCGCLDASAVLSEVVPTLFDTLLSGTSSSGGLLTSLGLPLNPSFKNLKKGTLGGELRKLLVCYKDCQGLLSYVQSFTGAGTLKGTAVEQALKKFGTYQDQLTELLDLFVDSKVLNPDDPATGEKNKNYIALVNLALSKLGDDYKVTADDLPADLEEENANFSACVVTLANSGLVTRLSLLTGSDLDMSVFKSVDFAALYKAIGKSAIISHVMVKVLDGKLLPAMQNITDDEGHSVPIDEGISFKNITDWETEGECMNTLIRFGSEMGDFKNVDYLNSDPVCIGKLLSALSQSQMFRQKCSNGNVNYLFPKFFAEKFAASVKNGGPAGYFSDIGTTSGNYTFHQLEADFTDLSALHDESGNVIYVLDDHGNNIAKTDAASIASWIEECEIRFTDVVRRTELIGGIDSFQSGVNVSTINPTDYDGLFTAVRQSKAFKRVLTFHLFEQAVVALQGSGGALKGANTAYLWTCTDEERHYECDCMAGLMYIILDNKYGLVSSTTGTLSTANISIDTASPEYCLDPFLTELGSSSVFNSLPSNPTADVDQDGNSYYLTACQHQIASLLDKAHFYIYKDGSATKTDFKSIYKAVQSVGTLSGASGTGITPAQTAADDDVRTSWGNEAQALGAVGTALQNFIYYDAGGVAHRFSIENFDVLSYFLSEDDGTAEVNAANAGSNNVVQGKVYDLLSAVNASKILYRALPIKIRLSLDQISDSNGSLGTDPAMTVLCTQLRATNVNSTATINAVDGEIYPYSAGEITDMAVLIRQASVLYHTDKNNTTARNTRSAALLILVASWTAAHHAA